ncbi:enoyl-CoA hydratase-related protein [Paraburkholderia sp. J63]|uniref:enoyl-CoA hydratase-related protein n=1 Tax=Paraburkholderia sp. J63 TaxID=2805434 RepID=UPI002ABDBCB0|nr:enoyl-CoA hydratase-related protein [Paraburkholderia sp. J63]
MMETLEGISWGVTDRIGRIVMNRPDRANSISLAASRALCQAIDAVLSANPHVVLLSAEGRIFCAGGDIDEFASAGDALDVLVDDILDHLHPALHRLTTAPMPVVTQVGGSVGGAGIGLALCGDFVLATESMKLRTGYVSIGLSPDVGASYFLARRVGELRAQQWLMLGEPVGAAQCLAAGAVDALFPDAELAGATEDLVQRLARSASGSLGSIKRLCTDALGRSLKAHLELEHELLRTCARSADAREGVRAFVEKRPPCFGVS